ncbi:hypothetical protein E2I00_011061 [Balaenoptera physalus]|uniref:HAP1 N-terminal domain-containing protein n=1 Tax=Balaenoptera physalus TaxID=9770 RepID=A0A643BM85_BALPH|nr:hypothetical protein E2I00_011061 [Balaenoptera physalus]
MATGLLCRSTVHSGLTATLTGIMMPQTGQRVEAVLEFGFISQPTRERHNTAPTHRPCCGNRLRIQDAPEKVGAGFSRRLAGTRRSGSTGIWKTPAAYIGRRPGVSGPERAAFIRELEEALCPDLHPPVKKITQEDVKVMLSLLEERERDLNTAARIGQSLVKQNSVLMEENSKLEAMLGSAREETPESESHRCPQLEALQEQLRLLEEENEQLREEVSQLDDLEEEEQMFILDCVEQFSEASQQMAELSEVLALRMENYEQQQREVAQLRAQVMKLQRCCWSYGAEAEKLQQQLASEKEIQMQLQDECGSMLIEAQEEVKTLRQQASTGSVTHYTYELHHSEDREQEQGLEAEEGLMSAEHFVPAEELGATEEALPAEEGVTEEAELVSEEAEAWEEVELELDEATQMNVVTSALEASGLGPSHLDMKCVLQQLANWQDAHYRQQLRQKMLQKGKFLKVAG